MKKNIYIFLITILAFVIFPIYNNVYASESSNNDNSSCMYLSDISYIENKSFACSKHSIHLDENESNDIIALNVNNEKKYFIKGICAWATSEIVYDLRNYNFDYFTSYLGVDISEQNNYFNTGVKFYIYTSDDGENWNEKLISNTLYGWSESQFVKVDISNSNYLKLVANNNSNSSWASWYDEAVFADAKLITKNYVEDTSSVDFIKTLDEYDFIINENFGNEITGEYELALLQRNFVYNVDYDILQALAKYKEEYKNTIYWLMNDVETLRSYLVGGKPEGSYLNSIKVLSSLYNTYKTDLENTNKTIYGTTYGDLYRTMMLSLSLTESGNVYLWIDGVCHSDALTRYEIYKNLHLHEGQDNELIENKIFESLTVEEMRWVMNTVIDDEEIVWLNNYVRTKGNGAISPYNYIKYTFGYDYSLDKYYDLSNYNTWNEKYNLSTYNITYKKGEPKLWIVFEEGSVCGGLSKTGSCIWGSFKGLPNTCVSQPGHCAYIYYTQDNNGNGIWNLGNDVSGWGQSGKTEHLNVRTMNDWGTGSYTSGWNANYILLAQAAQNEYEKYEKAEKILMLADIYKDNNTKLEEIYRSAIDVEPINFDSWLGLVNLYINDSSKTDKDYYDLSKEIVDVFTYYPYPMCDLLNLIKPHISSIEYNTIFTLLQTRALNTATQATSNETIQVQAVKQVANQLLGNLDTSIATFSFDGDNAGQIVLSSRFDDIDVAWEYSLDGGNNWILSEEHILQLTSSQISTITSTSDIKIHIMGVDYSEENIYTIDIKESNGLPKNLYANDLENKLIGATDYMQWKYEDSDNWTYYSVAKPDLTGDKTLIVRSGATGTYLAQTTSSTFTFSAENLPDTQKYISIDNLSIYDVSSEQTSSGDKSTNAIDGNIYTIWHTSHNGSDTDRTITLKLNEPTYLSALQYVPRQTGDNGRAKNVVVYLSLDGENWTAVCSMDNLENSPTPKMLEFNESTMAQYVKFVTTANWGNGNSFASAAMINLFEDVTKKEIIDSDDNNSDSNDNVQLPGNDNNGNNNNDDNNNDSNDNIQLPDNDNNGNNDNNDNNNDSNDNIQLPDNDNNDNNDSNDNNNDSNDNIQLPDNNNNSNNDSNDNNNDSNDNIQLPDNNNNSNNDSSNNNNDSNDNIQLPDNDSSNNINDNNNSNNENQNSVITTDTTTSPDEIPQTGTNYILLSCIVIGLILLAVFVIFKVL